MTTAEEAKNWLASYRKTELAHHGILGMKWGQHKAETAPLTKTQQVSKINKKLDHLNGNKIVAGAGLQGYYLQKQNKRLMKKTGQNYGDLSKSDQVAYQKKATNTAYRNITISNTTQLAGLGVTLGLATKLMPPGQVKRGAQLALAAITVIGAATTINQLQSVNQYTTSQQLQAQKRQLVTSK